MSVRRTVELNFVKRLEVLLKDTTYAVAESKELTEERKKPIVVLVAGDATNPFDNLPVSYGNYYVPLNVMVLTSKDAEGAIEMHEQVVTRIEQAFTSIQYRTQSVMAGLHLYDCLKGDLAEGDEDRTLGTAIAFQVVANYQPLPS